MTFTRGYFTCDNVFWWLVRVTLVVAFDFLLQHFGSWSDIWMVLYHSVKAGSVVGIPWGGGNTQIVPYEKNLYEIFALTGGGNRNTLDLSAHAISHVFWYDLSVNTGFNLIFFHFSLFELLMEWVAFLQPTTGQNTIWVLSKNTWDQLVFVVN